MTRITTPFAFASTAADVTEGVDLTGKRVVVTGGASGIGIETARTFATLGAEVTLAVRNTVAGKEVAANIAAATRNQDVHVAQLDLADRDTIHGFVDQWTGPLDVLVNNAGIMALPELQHTADGWGTAVRDLPEAARLASVGQDA